MIAATGFTCPLLDLPDLGVTTFGAAKLPAVTPFWESSSVPGIYFAGTIGQASPGLRRTASRPTRARSTARATTR